MNKYNESKTAANSENAETKCIEDTAPPFGNAGDLSDPIFRMAVFNDPMMLHHEPDEELAVIRAMGTKSPFRAMMLTNYLYGEEPPEKSEPPQAKPVP